MIRRAAPTLATVGVLIGAAVAALGRPDLPRAGRLFTGSEESLDAALAVVGILAWAAILALAGLVVAGALRAIASEAAQLNQRWSRAWFSLVIGVIVLAIGVLHHVATGYTTCCGTLTEANALGG